MRIILCDFMSLDGVVQAPGGPDEDRDGGFAHGGWSQPFFDPAVMGPVIGALLGTALDGALPTIYAAFQKRELVVAFNNGDTAAQVSVAASAPGPWTPAFGWAGCCRMRARRWWWAPRDRTSSAASKVIHAVVTALRTRSIHDV